MRNNGFRSLVAPGSLALLMVICASPVAISAVVNHGAIMGDTVSYLDVTETSTDPLPLYGAPVAMGDTLAFFEPTSPNPSIGFGAQAAGDSADITDGFLDLTVTAKPSYGINAISFSEGGDYTMSAIEPAAARVSANLNVFELRIIEVDNALIGPIVLSDLQTDIFNVPGDTDAGQWNLASSFDLNQALDDAGQTYALGATKLRVKVNNTLTALSQPGSLAGIFKKGFEIEVETVVPEPASIALLGLGGLGLLATRRGS